MSDEEKTPFDQWAIVEIMGHQRYAGRVTEQTIGGTSFVRVDVPANDERQPFTKLFGSGAIYALTIVDEETARAASASQRQTPMDEWSARSMLEALPQPDLDEYHNEDEEELPI